MKKRFSSFQLYVLDISPFGPFELITKAIYVFIRFYFYFVVKSKSQQKNLMKHDGKNPNVLPPMVYQLSRCNISLPHYVCSAVG